MPATTIRLKERSDGFRDKHAQSDVVLLSTQESTYGECCRPYSTGEHHAYRQQVATYRQGKHAIGSLFVLNNVVHQQEHRGQYQIADNERGALYGILYQTLLVRLGKGVNVE